MIARRSACATADVAAPPTPATSPPPPPPPDECTPTADARAPNLRRYSTAGPCAAAASNAAARTLASRRSPPSATSSWHDTHTNAAPSEAAAVLTADRFPTPAAPVTNAAVFNRNLADSCGCIAGARTSRTCRVSEPPGPIASSSPSSTSAPAKAAANGGAAPAAADDSSVHRVHSAPTKNDPHVPSPPTSSPLTPRTVKWNAVRRLPVADASSATSAVAMNASPVASSLGVRKYVPRAYSAIPPLAHGSTAWGGDGTSGAGMRAGETSTCVARGTRTSLDTVTSEGAFTSESASITSESAPSPIGSVGRRPRLAAMHGDTRTLSLVNASPAATMRAARIFPLGGEHTATRSPVSIPSRLSASGDAATSASTSRDADVDASPDASERVTGAWRIATGTLTPASVPATSPGYGTADADPESSNRAPRCVRHGEETWSGKPASERTMSG